MRIVPRRTHRDRHRRPAAAPTPDAATATAGVGVAAAPGPAEPADAPLLGSAATGSVPPQEPQAPEPPVLVLTRTSVEQRARDHLALAVSALNRVGVEHWHVPNPARPSPTRLGTFAEPGAVLAALAAELGPEWALETWDPASHEWVPARDGTGLAAPAAVRTFATVWDPGRNRRIAAVAAVEVDCWIEDAGQLVAALQHVRGTTIPAGEGRTPPRDVRGQSLWTWQSLAVQEPTSLGAPIDAVFTWVNSADPDYWAARAPWLADPATDDQHSRGAARTRSLDELRYALRSLDMYAPWVNRVWLLTDGQRPTWLDTDRVTVLDHRDVLGGHVVLPTFNSHAIESGLHRIDGLTEHFLYFNDDTMLGARAAPEDFFTPAGHLVFQPSGEVLPAGPVGPDEAAPGVAGRTVRALLEHDFGRTVTHKLRHTPHPLRRSLVEEVATRYSQHWQVTSGNRFRSSTDIAPVQLALWYALLTGRAVTSKPSYTYVELAAVTSPAELGALTTLLRRSRFMCMNMRADPLLGWDELEASTSQLLDALFPFTSRFEL